MIPLLYGKTENSFQTNGLGRLSDAVSCTVTEELNGIYELALEYPADGIHAGDLDRENIIFAAHDEAGDRQPFRIYKRTDNLGGTFAVLARHVCYDLTKIPVEPFSVGSSTAQDALSALASKALLTIPFTFTSDITATKSFVQEIPASAKAILGDGDGSILSVYGGEVKYDRFAVSVLARRGEDKPVTIRYGKNMTGIEVVSELSEVYDAVVPFCKTQDGVILSSPKIVKHGTTATAALPLDLSDAFEEVPTAAEVTEAATAWLNAKQPWITERAITVSFVELWQTEEYKNVAPLQTVLLGDGVKVTYQRLNVDAVFRVFKTVYDVLRGRYTEITLGRDTESVDNVIAQMSKKIQQNRTDTHDIANGTYTGGTFINKDDITGPHIWADATLNVGARNDPTPIGPSGSVAGKYNFNVDSNGSLRIGPMAIASAEEASLEEDESSSSGSESKDPSVVYKFNFDAADNVLSLHGNYAVHNSAGTKIGYMGRITGSAGDSGSTEGVAFTVGNNPQSVTDEDDSFFLATSGGARLNYHGNKVYASGNYVKMEHKDDVSVTLGSTLGSGWISLKYGQSGPSVLVSSSAVSISAGGHNITVDSTGAFYDSNEIMT